MHVVPFPVLGSASSGTVIVRVHTRAGLYVCGPISDTGLCHFLYGLSLNFVRIEQRLERRERKRFSNCADSQKWCLLLRALC